MGKGLWWSKTQKQRASDRMSVANSQFRQGLFFFQRKDQSKCPRGGFYTNEKKKVFLTQMPNSNNADTPWKEK